MIVIDSLKCLMCGDIIFSRSQHDFISCYCGNISADGGSSYYDTNSCAIRGSARGRRMAIIFEKVEKVSIDISSLSIDKNNIERELYDDWNKRKNKYGIIRDFSYSEEERNAAKAKLKLLE